MPYRVGDAVVLAQVGEGHDVAVAFVAAGLVGYPQFNALDGHARHHGGQAAHVVVIVVAEEVGEEEVAVFLVFRGGELEFVRLCAALRGHAFRGRFLLRHHRLQFQLAELQVGAQAEEGRCTFDERRVGGQRHVAGFYELDDFVFLAFVAQLHALRVEVEGGFGVVVQVHVDFVAHAAVHAHVDVFLEVETERLAAVLGQAGVVGLLHVRPDFELGRPLRLDAHSPRAEDFFCRAEVELHVGEVEFVFACVFKFFGVALAVIGAERLLQAPVLVFFGRHQDGGVQVAVADFSADGVIPCLRVIYCVRDQVVGVFQVHALAFQVGFLLRCRAFHAEARAYGVRLGRSFGLQAGKTHGISSHVCQGIRAGSQENDVA